MNVSLLQDPNYLEELKQNIPLWKTTRSDNLSHKRCIWDWLKYRSFSLSRNKKLIGNRRVEEANKIKCYKRLIYKQFVQISGLNGPQFLSYLPKRFTHLSSALYGDAMLFCPRKRKPKNDLLWKKTYNKYTRKQLKNLNRTLQTLTL